MGRQAQSAPPAVAAGVSRGTAGPGALITGLHYRLRFEIPADEAGPIAVQAVISSSLRPLSVPAAGLSLGEEPLCFSAYQWRLPRRSNWRRAHPAAGGCPAPGAQRGGDQLHRGRQLAQPQPDFSLYAVRTRSRPFGVPAVYDQPDLKARFVEPGGSGHWLALGNGPLAQRIELDDARWEFSICAHGPDQFIPLSLSPVTSRPSHGR